jgi:hypothetical protein
MKLRMEAASAANVGLVSADCIAPGVSAQQKKKHHPPKLGPSPAVLMARTSAQAVRFLRRGRTSNFFIEIISGSARDIPPRGNQ